MGRELRAQLELREDVSRVSANLWLPESVGQKIGIEIAIGAQSGRSALTGGLNTISLDVSNRAGQTVEFSLVSDATYEASAADARQVSALVNSIVLTGGAPDDSVNGGHYLPLLGLARVKSLPRSLFDDGWMGKELRGDLELRQPVGRVIWNLWLPDDRQVDLLLSFGGSEIRKRVDGGMNTITLDVSHERGEVVPLAIIADETFAAEQPDPRQLSVIVNSIVLEP